MAVAARYGKSVAQVCIRYALQHGLVALPKSTHPARIVENGDVDFVIGKDDFAEYAASRESSFVADQTGKGSPVDSVDVNGTPWQHVRSGGHDSLVKEFGPVSVVVGGVRDKATLAELTTLAASLS